MPLPPRRFDNRRVVRTALVVDDHPSFRRLAGRLLTAAGYRVVAEAADVAGGLAQGRRWRPTLALVDVLLPDGSGTEVADGLAPLGVIALLTSSRAAGELGPEVARHPFLPKDELTVDRLDRCIGGPR
jgi:CheY-like chemotaxis protein